jgi:DNA-binding response OmpR family regulator
MLVHAEKRKPVLPPEEIELSRNLDVLVVHDDEPLRRFLDRHLRHAGYHVRVAGDSIGASGLIFREPPDVMVLDLDMRGLNCFEFLAGLRADGRVPFFPVIYLTSDMVAATYARELGAACVRKPVQPAKLLATIAMSALIQPPATPSAPH